MENAPRNMNRRTFIQTGVTALGAAALTASVSGLIGCADSSQTDEREANTGLGDGEEAGSEKTVTDSGGINNQIAGLTEKPAEDATPLMTLFAISDTHIGSATRPDVDKHLTGALADISAINPDIDGIFINGDLTDNGFQAEYDTLRALIEGEGYAFGDLTFSIGNHDLRVENSDSEPYDTLRERFLANTGLSSLYYDTTIGGQHVIVLGCDDNPDSWDCSKISQTQLDWLDTMLAADRSAGVLSFVFNHFPVVGTMGEAGQTSWSQSSRLENSDALRGVLDRYPQVIYMAGHYHSNLYAYHTAESAPLYLNDGSVGYASGLHGSLYQTVNDSYGWYMELFEDRIRVRGRDFLEQAWIANKDITIAIDKMRG